MGGPDFDTLKAEAVEVPLVEGLLVLPYLAGERTPVFDPEARADWWLGSRWRHTRAHLFRAAYEGIGFGIRSIVDLFDEIGDAGYADGGGLVVTHLCGPPSSAISPAAPS